MLVLYGLLMLVFIGGSRFLVHLLYERPLRGFRARRDARSVLIVGAGDGGRLLLREILRNPELGYRPVGFVDDDPRKQRARIDRGLSVLGTTDGAAARARGRRARRGADRRSRPRRARCAPASSPPAASAACPVRTMPTVFELLQTGGRLLRQVREVEVEDVLGREPVRMDLDRVGGYLTGRVVLVTGAGGSIGSELCRQIARVGPSQLVLLDHAEDNLFEIRRELVEDRHVLNTVAVLADCKEGERMREVFAEHRPAIVFHAAAYKHVHLMEENPVEAVRNNALATRLMCQVAGRGRRARRSCSSRPTRRSRPRRSWARPRRSPSGRSRRPTQRYPGDRVLRRALRQRARLVGLRRADLPPPDRRRRARSRSPHREMTRYFMTIPEAVQLVIRSGLARASGGEVFVLEMGEPVKIIDLARDMIRLSGLEPERDIAIEVDRPAAGREAARGAVQPLRAAAADARRRRSCARSIRAWIPRGSRRPSTRSNWLVLDGDAAALAAKVGELAAVRQVPPALDPSAAVAADLPGSRDGA